MWNNISTVPITLIETILVLPNKTPFLNTHIKRMQDSIQQMNWPQDNSFINTIEHVLHGLAKQQTQAIVYKIEWTFSGYQYLYNWSNRPVPNPTDLEEWRLAPHQLFYNLHTQSSNLKLAFRNRYERGKQQHPDVKDLLIFNQYGQLTESTIANLFFKIKGAWFTPCLSTGCVNGVFRREFIKESKVESILLHINQIHQIEELYLGNAVRGLWKGLL